jgi:hypothetical protein
MTISVTLPGGGAPVPARIVRSANGIVAVAFRTDKASFTQVSSALVGLAAA